MKGSVVWEWWFFDHVVQDVNSTKPDYVGTGKTIADHPGRININQDVALFGVLFGIWNGPPPSISWFTWFTNRRQVPGRLAAWRLVERGRGGETRERGRPA